MLEVRGGKAIDVATQEAVASDDLRHLETEVLATFRRGLEAERTARTDAQRLYLAAIRQIYRFLRSDRDKALPSGPAAAQIEDIEP
jgi:F-type H+-transporting ATPase subunit epsilon